MRNNQVNTREIAKLSKPTGGLRNAQINFEALVLLCKKNHGAVLGCV